MRFGTSDHIFNIHDVQLIIIFISLTEIKDIVENLDSKITNHLTRIAHSQANQNMSKITNDLARIAHSEANQNKSKITKGCSITFMYKTNAYIYMYTQS